MPAMPRRHLPTVCILEAGVPLLLIPLLILGVLALWIVLLPLSILQRYRHGKARHRARPLAVRLNAWVLLASVPPFLAGAWISQYWVTAALLQAALGLAAGGMVGILGIWITPIERTPQGLFYTPRAWLVLLLSLLVALRIALGVWHMFQRWHVAGSLPALLAGQASLFAMAGLLLGYYLMYAWGLKRRLG
jgi:hypothetical protein